MSNTDHTLEIRLTIVMIKEGYNFLHSLLDYQQQLKKHFKEHYELDKIETALKAVEEAYIIRELNEDREIVEFPEDY